MIHDPYIIPPLPQDWRYAPGLPLRPLGCRLNLELPGLGGGWRVCTPDGSLPPGVAEPLGGGFGRGGVLRAGDWVLRPYRRGGLLRRINDRTYRTHLRFAAEHAVHRGLWEAGFPTVEPLGYAWRPKGMGVEGVLLTRFSEGVAWPHDWSLGTERMGDLLHAIHALCAWGLWSPDLNATNVLLPSTGGVRLLDWDRARFEPPSPELLARYRRRLLRSLRKLQAPETVTTLIESGLRPG